MNLNLSHCQSVVSSFHKIFEFCVVILFLSIFNYQIIPLYLPYFLDCVLVKALPNFKSYASFSSRSQTFHRVCLHVDVHISTLLCSACIFSHFSSYIFISVCFSVVSCSFLFSLLLHFGAVSIELYHRDYCCGDQASRHPFLISDSGCLIFLCTSSFGTCVSLDRLRLVKFESRHLSGSLLRYLLLVTGAT